jgi:transcriptional regulator with XRE-family HTH domain
MNVARRIAHEREARAWSYAGLAERMSRAGCAIDASAIFKIEKGEPRRRITVDEMVAFAEVFGVPVDELLLPMEQVLDRAQREAARRIERASRDLRAAADKLRAAFAEAEILEHSSPAFPVGPRYTQTMLEHARAQGVTDAADLDDSLSAFILAISRSAASELKDADAAAWSAHRGRTQRKDS